MRSFAGRQKTCQKKRMHKKRHGQKIMIKKKKPKSTHQENKTERAATGAQAARKNAGKTTKNFFCYIYPN